MLDIGSSKDIYIFLFSINQGIVIGLLYDFYRVIRGSLNRKKIIGVLQDLILWIVITFLVFIFLFKPLDGNVRGFVFIGFFIGGLFYIKTLSPFIFPVLFKIFKLILYIINEIIKTILYPFKSFNSFFKRSIKKYKKLARLFIGESKKYIKIITKKK